MRKTMLYLGLCAIICVCTGRIGNTNSLENNGPTLFMTDTYNHVIYEIDKITGSVTVFAGKTGSPGLADGKRTSRARFNGPNGIADDGKNLYIADSNNHTIRTIDKATGTISTFAGKAGKRGSADGTGPAARFDSPTGLFRVGSDLYVTDSNNQTIRKIATSTQIVTTIAGTAGMIGSSDGVGAAATFNFPNGIYGDGENLYVADTNNNTIRKIVIATGTVSTFAGKAGAIGATDGIGYVAEFYTPRCIAGDGRSLYVSDNQNNTIRKIDKATGNVTTFAGISNQIGFVDGPGSTAQFNAPDGLVCDADNLYVADTTQAAIRKIVLSTAVVSTIQIKRR